MKVQATWKQGLDCVAIAEIYPRLHRFSLGLSVGCGPFPRWWSSDEMSQNRVENATIAWSKLRRTDDDLSLSECSWTTSKTSFSSLVPNSSPSHTRARRSKEECPTWISLITVVAYRTEFSWHCREYRWRCPWNLFVWPISELDSCWEILFPSRKRQSDVTRRRSTCLAYGKTNLSLSTCCFLFIRFHFIPRLG